MKTKEDREELRHAVLEVVYARPGPVLTARAISRVVQRAVSFTVDEEDIRAELQFLKNAGYVESVRDDLGSTEYWKVTAAGTLFYERGT
jgi:Fe2+ or Zn2+ uptake regulation protein